MRWPKRHAGPDVGLELQCSSSWHLFQPDGDPFDAVRNPILYRKGVLVDKGIGSDEYVEPDDALAVGIR